MNVSLPHHPGIKQSKYGTLPLVVIGVYNNYIVYCHFFIIPFYFENERIGHLHTEHNSLFFLQILFSVSIQ